MTAQLAQNAIGENRISIRDYLDSLQWNKTPPAPWLPENVVGKTTEKYLEAYQRLTGRSL